MTGPTCHTHPARVATWIMLVDDERPVTACSFCAQTALESPAGVALTHVPDDLAVIDLDEDQLIDLVTIQDDHRLMSRPSAP